MAARTRIIPGILPFQISIGLMYVILEEKILKSLRFILAIKTLIYYSLAIIQDISYEIKEYLGLAVIYYYILNCKNELYYGKNRNT